MVCFESGVTVQEVGVCLYNCPVGPPRCACVALLCDACRRTLERASASPPTPPPHHTPMVPLAGGTRPRRPICSEKCLDRTLAVVVLVSLGFLIDRYFLP